MSQSAERSILGAILLANTSLGVAQQCGLQPSNFVLESHRRIYLRMVDLAGSGRPIDPIILAEELRRYSELDRIGGPAYIMGLIDGVPESASVEHYVKIVHEAADRRRAA